MKSKPRLHSSCNFFKTILRRCGRSAVMSSVSTFSENTCLTSSTHTSSWSATRPDRYHTNKSGHGSEIRLPSCGMLYPYKTAVSPGRSHASQTHRRRRVEKPMYTFKFFLSTRWKMQIRATDNGRHNAPFPCFHQRYTARFLVQILAPPCKTMCSAPNIQVCTACIVQPANHC